MLIPNSKFSAPLLFSQRLECTQNEAIQFLKTQREAVVLSDKDTTRYLVLTKDDAAPEKTIKEAVVFAKKYIELAKQKARQKDWLLNDCCITLSKIASRDPDKTIDFENIDSDLYDWESVSEIFNGNRSYSDKDLDGTFRNIVQRVWEA